MLKKFFSIIICICLLLCTSLPAISVSAAVIKKGNITVATVSGNTGDTVIVPITISDNPGIAGITVSITYDSSALEFVEDLMGDVIYEYLTKAHPAKNIIRLVTAESGNKYNNGTLLSLKFKIADKAKAGLYKIDIKYNEGDFCNWKLDRIMPTIAAGGVNVNLSTANCPHESYGEWSQAAIASCTESGAEKRTCNACGHVELRDTKPLGHEYSNEFTIDKEATENETGLMSRHCIRCKDFIDQISYTLEQSEEGKIDNTFNTNIPANDYINNIYKEQYPQDNPDGQKPESSTPSISSNPKAPSEDGTASSEKATTDTENTDTLLTEEKEDKILNNTIIGKIAEIFPEVDTILKIFKIAVILLLKLTFI